MTVTRFPMSEDAKRREARERVAEIRRETINARLQDLERDVSALRDGLMMASIAVVVVLATAIVVAILT